jgi:protein gp37
VGGESGPKAHPMKAEWVKKIIQQCENHSISFFFKQWGGWGPDGKKRAKKKNGRILSGKTWDNMPEFV